MSDVQILIKRDVNNYKSSEELVNDIIKERFSFDDFIATTSSLINPYEFKDMSKAINLIVKHLKRGSNICVYGDYDVDGTTSVDLTYELLLKLTKQIQSRSKIGYYIPHREKEGYGVHNAALDRIKNEGGYSLVVTVDCGIASYLQVQHAHSIGLDVIITDHHEYPQNVPDCPVINPHDGVYPFTKLSGCGTVFKFMEALFMHYNLPKSIVYSYLDIVAMSTIADLMELVGENRILVKYGLIIMQNNVGYRNRPWINALLEVAKFDREIDSFTIGFVLGPRINSVGRLSHSLASVKFMLEKDEEKLAAYAKKIDELNNERKELQENIVAVADKMVEEEGVQNAITLVVDGRVGVVGLAASNILEKNYRPTTIFSSSVSPDVYKASARSIEGFDYFKEVIEANRDIIVGGGGHAAAAGLSVKKENIDEFSKRVNEAVERCLKNNPNLLTRKIKIDALLEPDFIDVAFVKKIEQLAPFGMGNEAPVFMLKNMTISSVLGVPKKDPKHIQIVLSRGEYVFKGIIFKRYDLMEELKAMSTIDVAFTLSINTFMGKTEVNLLINYYKPSDEEVNS